MRALALAAALASAVTPASAAAPVEGACEFVMSPVDPSTLVLAAYAAASVPSTEVGVACWVAEGGEGWANASNPGVATVATGVADVWGPFVICEQHWVRLASGAYYTSPAHCV